MFLRIRMNLPSPWDQVAFYGGIVLFGIVPALIWVFRFSPPARLAGREKCGCAGAPPTTKGMPATAAPRVARSSKHAFI
jgi:hypothetical protein